MHVDLVSFQDVGGNLSTRVQQLDVITDTKTKDNVTMKLKIAVYEVMNHVVKTESGGDIPDTSRGHEDHGVYRAFTAHRHSSAAHTPCGRCSALEILKRKLDEGTKARRPLLTPCRML